MFNRFRLVFGSILGLTGLFAVFVTSIVLVSRNQQPSDSYIRKHVGDSVVRVLVGMGGGTGFHVTAKSGKVYILTNKHVCDGAPNGEVGIQFKEGRVIPRIILDMYDKHDLCLIEPLAGFKGLALAEKSPKIGAAVGIVGHPLLNPMSYMKGFIIGNPKIDLVLAENIEERKCSGKFLDLSDTMYAFFGLFTICYDTYETLQTDYVAYKGNSGSPTIDIFGKVVGVHFAGRNDANTIGYIVPLKYVKAFLKDY